MGSFTHIDDKNNPTMVDVSHKDETLREAVASSKIFLPLEILEHFCDGEIFSKKGPVLQTAIIAGTMAAKKTHDLIPFCHQLNLDSVKINISKFDTGLDIVAITKTRGPTGVEMEALVACQVAALTVYDMCKGLSQKMEIGSCHLVKKTGGKSDYKKV